MELKQFEGQAKNELAMVDVAYAILETTGEVMDFNDLLAEVADYLEMADDALEAEMAQFYTDLNVDGRYISLGTNRWGLRSWYPIDSIDEEITHDNDEEDERPRRRKRRRKELDDEYEKELGEEDLEDEDDEEEEEDDEIEYGQRVAVDEHGVMVDEDDAKDIDEYKEDLEELGDDEEDEELEGLTIVDDEEVLGDDEEEEE